MDWKKCLLLPGQYKMHNKLTAVTFKSSLYWKLEVAVAAFVAKTTYCFEIQSQRLTAVFLSLKSTKTAFFTLKYNFYFTKSN